MTTLDVYCPASADPYTTVRSSHQPIQGRACFTFRQLCYLQSHNGEILLPSSTDNRPYTLVEPVTLGSPTDFFRDSTLTELTPPTNVSD